MTMRRSFLIALVALVALVGVSAACGDNCTGSVGEYMAQQPCEDVLAKYYTARSDLGDDLDALRRVANLYTIMAERENVPVRVYSADVLDRVNQCR